MLIDRIIKMVDNVRLAVGKTNHLVLVMHSLTAATLAIELNVPGLAKSAAGVPVEVDDSLPFGVVHAVANPRSSGATTE